MNVFLKLLKLINEIYKKTDSINHKFHLYSKKNFLTDMLSTLSLLKKKIHTYGSKYLYEKN